MLVWKMRYKLETQPFLRLKKYAPDICEELASMNEVLWDAAKSLPISGRVLYAAQLGHRRLDDPLLMLG